MYQVLIICMRFRISKRLDCYGRRGSPDIICYALRSVEVYSELVCNSEFSVNGSYKESWNFIQIENRSVCKYTNFSVYLRAYKSC